MFFHRCSGKVLSKNIFDDLHRCLSCCHQSDGFSSSKKSSDHSLDSTQKANTSNECDNYDDEESIFRYHEASSTALKHNKRQSCTEIEADISGQSIDSVSNLPSKRATSAVLKPRKRRCTENEKRKSGQSIDSVSPEASSTVSEPQIEQHCPQSAESQSVFIVQNSSDNFSNDREVSQEITRTRSKLKNDENELQDFIKIPKGADVSKLVFADRENDTTGSTKRTNALKYYPRKETYLKNTFLKFQKGCYSLKSLKKGSENFSECKKSKFIVFYNFCMNLKSDKNFSRGISLRPKHDAGKKYKKTKHRSYNNDFYWEVFENMSVRRAFELYIDYIFEDNTMSLKFFFKFNCCLETSCSTSCHRKWESLKKRTIKVFIVRPEDREEF